QVTDLRGGAVAVVRHPLDEDGDATRPVALVDDLLIRFALELAGAFLDRPLDRVAGDATRAGLDEGAAQPRVGLGIAAAHARGDRDLAQDLREHLDSAGVGGGLAVLDRAPFAVA